MFSTVVSFTIAYCSMLPLYRSCVKYRCSASLGDIYPNSERRGEKVLSVSLSLSISISFLLSLSLSKGGFPLGLFSGFSGFLVLGLPPFLPFSLLVIAFLNLALTLLWVILPSSVISIKSTIFNHTLSEIVVPKRRSTLTLSLAILPPLTYIKKMHSK